MSGETPLQEPVLQEMAERIGHEFGDARLLVLALSHASWANERDGETSNERLEFLGDAVLDLALAHLLYAAHPDWSEGELTLARKSLVNSAALAGHARALDLGAAARLGRSEIRGGGEDKDRILANLFEAVIGAVYLDAGFDAVMTLVRARFAADLEGGSDLTARDPKTRLQEWAHAEHQQTPRYRVVDDSGVDADETRFGVEVRLGDRAAGQGRGRSKRVAEQSAAEDALARLVDGA